MGGAAAMVPWESIATQSMVFASVTVVLRTLRPARLAVEMGFDVPPVTKDDRIKKRGNFLKRTAAIFTSSGEVSTMLQFSFKMWVYR